MSDAVYVGSGPDDIQIAALSNICKKALTSRDRVSSRRNGFYDVQDVLRLFQRQLHAVRSACLSAAFAFDLSTVTARSGFTTAVSLFVVFSSQCHAQFSL
jgi:hypothetical protein